MNQERDEKLGALGEALMERGLEGSELEMAELATEFGLSEEDVRACIATLEAVGEIARVDVTELGLFFEGELDGDGGELTLPSLPEQFELQEEVGRGGMGVVYRARHKGLDRDVAVKVLLPGELMFGSAISRFQQEARAMARLRHPHIVSIHDVGRSEGTVWFSMDLVDGHPLSRLISKGEITPARAVKILLDVTDAVAYVHEHGLIHRDLKPQNVLVDTDGEVFVTDFGLARETREDAAGLTQTGQALGTPAYMSPEQARGDLGAVGETTDVHALGALLYECLAGVPPFRGASPVQVLQAVVNEEPPPLRKYRKNCHPDLEAICRKAMEKDPVHRYASVRAMHGDLLRFQKGIPTVATNPDAARHLRRWARRNVSNLASAAAGAMVVAAVLWWIVLPKMMPADLSEVRTLDGARALVAAEEWREAHAFLQPIGKKLEEGQRHEAMRLQSRCVIAMVPEMRAAGEIAEARRLIEEVIERGRTGWPEQLQVRGLSDAPLRPWPEEEELVWQRMLLNEVEGRTRERMQGAVDWRYAQLRGRFARLDVRSEFPHEASLDALRTRALDEMRDGDGSGRELAACILVNDRSVFPSLMSPSWPMSGVRHLQDRCLDLLRVLAVAVDAERLEETFRAYLRDGVPLVSRAAWRESGDLLQAIAAGDGPEPGKSIAARLLMRLSGSPPGADAGRLWSAMRDLGGAERHHFRVTEGMRLLEGQVAAGTIERPLIAWLEENAPGRPEGWVRLARTPEQAQPWLKWWQEREGRSAVAWCMEALGLKAIPPLDDRARWLALTEELTPRQPRTMHLLLAMLMTEEWLPPSFDRRNERLVDRWSYWLTPVPDVDSYRVSVARFVCRGGVWSCDFHAEQVVGLNEDMTVRLHSRVDGDPRYRETRVLPGLGWGLTGLASPRREIVEHVKLRVEQAGREHTLKLTDRWHAWYPAEQGLETIPEHVRHPRTGDGGQFWQGPDAWFSRMGWTFFHVGRVIVMDPDGGKTASEGALDESVLVMAAMPVEEPALGKDPTYWTAAVIEDLARIVREADRRTGSDRRHWIDARIDQIFTNLGVLCELPAAEGLEQIAGVEQLYIEAISEESAGLLLAARLINGDRSVLDAEDLVSEVSRDISLVSHMGFDSSDNVTDYWIRLWIAQPDPAFRKVALEGLRSVQHANREAGQRGAAVFLAAGEEMTEPFRVIHEEEKHGPYFAGDLGRSKSDCIVRGVTLGALMLGALTSWIVRGTAGWRALALVIGLAASVALAGWRMTLGADHIVPPPLGAALATAFAVGLARMGQGRWRWWTAALLAPTTLVEGLHWVGVGVPAFVPGALTGLAMLGFAELVAGVARARGHRVRLHGWRLLYGSCLAVAWSEWATTGALQLPAPTTLPWQGWLEPVAWLLLAYVLGCLTLAVRPQRVVGVAPAG